MTTPLFLLRCVQLGLSIRDLDLLTIGMVNDMYMRAGTMNISMRWWPHKKISINFSGCPGFSLIWRIA